MILVFIIALAFGIAVWYFFKSFIGAIVVFFIALGYLAMKWNEAGATINMATQDKRDKAILNELKKMNQDKDNK